MSTNTDIAAEPARRTEPLRFALRVYPAQAGRPWSAQLVADDGERRDFDTACALLGHLLRIGQVAGAGGLR